MQPGPTILRWKETNRIAVETVLHYSHLDGYNKRLTYTVAEAKNRLPELIKQAEAGIRVTITKRGIPVVEIVRKAEDSRTKRIFGVLGNKKLVLDPDWARPQEDMDAWLAGDV